MRNTLRILARDLKRVAKNPAALLVLIFLCVLPSLYTWFNVAAFWDPYGHTGNIRVCVVNEDEGANAQMLGQMNIGDQLVDKLKDNTQLGWTFTDRDDAMSQVRSGEAYAAIVIPKNFTKKITSLLGKKPEQAKFDYYVNEKENAVAPKVTDTGESTLDATINSSFASTASEAVATAVDDELKSARSGIDDAKESAIGKIKTARNDISDARDTLAQLQETADSGKAKAARARKRLGQMESDLDDLSSSIEEVPALVSDASQSLLAYSARAGRLADRGAALLSRASASTSAGVLSLSNDVTRATGTVGASIARANALVAESRELESALETLEAQAVLPATRQQIASIRSGLETQTTRAENAVKALRGINNDLKTAASSGSKAATDVNKSVQSALQTASGARSELTGKLVPAAGSALSGMSSLASTLSASSARQDVAFGQAKATLRQLERSLSSTKESLQSTDATLAGLDKTLADAQTDLGAISASKLVTNVLGQGSISPSKVAKFMKSPTVVKTESLYPLNVYGSGMAPLFVNLTLWIGVFMLMVIVRLEVDDEGVEGATATQRYFGRWLFLAGLVALQAIICCAGCVIMGVQTVSMPLFFLTAVVGSLTYLSIQYMLSTTLQHIGKGLCVILVFLQIPGATGLYPVELTNGFFRAVYNFLPFTYGINALRETIGGFYDGEWAFAIGILCLYFAVFIALGAALRNRTINLNRMFARKLKESDLFNVESVEMPEMRFRNSRLVLALTSRDEYRALLDERYEAFLRRYPRLKLGALLAGLGVPVVITTVLSLLGFSRVWLLTLWLIWIVALMLFLVIVEFFRDSYERQRRLGDLSEDELAAAYTNRHKIGRSDATHREDIAEPVDDGKEGTR